jgi:hypothetical protein
VVGDADLVILIGPTHPPRRDSAELSCRKIVGYASLAIPFLCFPPQGVRFNWAFNFGVAV